VREGRPINIQKLGKQQLTQDSPGSPGAHLAHPAAHPGSPRLVELKAAGSLRLTLIGEAG